MRCFEEVLRNGGRLWLLGSDVDATYLDEIQVMESLMLVPALVGMWALIDTHPSQPARVSARAVPKAGRSLLDRLAP